jgi:hypothetical protein
MESQTFDIYSFIGKQFLTLAKRFCKNFQYDTLCEAIIDTENYSFFVNSDEETITISK